MKILIEINQNAAAFSADPSKAVMDALTLAGKRLMSGSVHGSALSLEGEHVCSWRVVEYVNTEGELVQNP